MRPGTSVRPARSRTRTPSGAASPGSPTRAIRQFSTRTAAARDQAVLDEDGGALTNLRAGAVEQTRVRQPQRIDRRRGRCEERAEARGHAAIADHTPTVRVGSLTI